MKTIATVLALAASLAVMGIAALESRANRGYQIPESLPPAREGAQVDVNVLAAFVDDSGQHISAWGVQGLQVSLTPSSGDSSSIATRGSVTDEPLLALAGHEYTVTARLGTSALSISITPQGYVRRGQDVGRGGVVYVYVLQSDNTIQSVTYYSPVYV